MKSGVIGTTSGVVDTVKSFTEKTEKDGRSLESCIEIVSEVRAADGELLGQLGRAALDQIVDSRSVEIDDNSIITTKKSQVETQYTEFLLSVDGFIVVKDSGGTFAFDLLGEHQQITIERTEIGLNSFISAHESAKPWKVGFYGKSGNADNGVVHGTEVWNDPELGGLLQDQRKNQLGVDIDWKGREIKMVTTESGYVDVYQPGDFSNTEFLMFVRDEVIPHASD